MIEGTERLMDFTPAFDKRSPDPKKNYGIHGVELRMVLKGPLGAVQFVLYTNWQLPHVRKEFQHILGTEGHPHLFHEPQPADIGYHSPAPQYEGQTAMGGTCEYLDGRTCYYDGSSLRAKDVFNVLCEKGSDGVWEYLEDEYRVLFMKAQAVS